MDALKSKKIEEAKKHIADAEKSLKTSLFKRKPDNDSAASQYSQAATCYKVAKELNNSIECYKKSAECYHNNNSLYHAAKQWEQVSFLANEAKNYQLTFEAIEKAADMMMLDGTRDSAGIILEKAAGMLKHNDPARALKIYKKLIYISEVEDKNHEQVVSYEQAIGIAMKLENYPEAIELIEGDLKVLDEVGTVEQITKYVLTLVLIHLNKDDWVSAKKCLEGAQAKYQGTFTRVSELVECYDQKDDEKFKALIKNYLSYAVDNEALKLANKIVRSEEWIKECEAAVQDSKVRNPTNNSNVEAVPKQTYADKNYAPQAPSYTAPDEDEDEEEIDLK